MFSSSFVAVKCVPIHEWTLKKETTLRNIYIYLPLICSKCDLFCFSALMHLLHSLLISSTSTHFSLFDKFVGLCIQIKVKASVNLLDRQLRLVAYGEADWTRSRGLEAIQRKREQRGNDWCMEQKRPTERERDGGPRQPALSLFTTKSHCLMWPQNLCFKPGFFSHRMC